MRRSSLQGRSRLRRKSPAPYRLLERRARRVADCKTVASRSRTTSCGSSGATAGSVHPRLPRCSLCHRRRRADAGAGGKSRGRRHVSVTCGANTRPEGNFVWHVVIVTCIRHTSNPQRRRFALHRGPFCFDPAQHLDARCAGKVSPQFDLGERPGSDGRKFHLRVGRARAQRQGHPLPLDAFRSTVQIIRAFPTQAYSDGYPAWMKKLRQSAGLISSVAMAQALHRPSSVRLASLRKMFLNLAKACSIGSRSGL